MPLDDIIRKAVKIADSVTKSAQDTIIHRAWIGQAGDGGPEYAGPVERKAIVEQKTRPAYTPAGQLMLIRATVTIVGPVSATSAKTGQSRTNPIDDRDIIILPDGSTGPIVGTNGLVDPDINAPYLVQVMLGK